MEYMLLETEKLHAKVRRYTSPEEHPFFPSFLPEPILPALKFPQQISPIPKSAVDVNAEVMRWYVEKIIDRLCIAGDDEQHGSSVLCDIAAMQALSRRVHFGKFVAESKFLKDPETYTTHLKNKNVEAIVNLLTNVDVERKVLRRAFVKASTYGQDISGTTEGFKIDPILIADIYRDMIIPLTKDVEIRYLFHRVGLSPPTPETYYDMLRGPLDAFEDPDAFKDLKLPVNVQPPITKLT
jgi:chorismate mutase